MQDDGEVKLHTVGRPLPGVDVRIDDSGEILVRSGSVFGGYFDDEAASAAALDDGWLHTGDAGYLEPDGHLVVLGRVSEVVHTASGERYIPNYIENRLKFSPYDRTWRCWARAATTWRPSSASTSTPVGPLGRTARHLVHVLRRPVAEARGDRRWWAACLPTSTPCSSPSWLSCADFVNLHKDFDADDGEITRTRKLRRNVIEERYARLIDALYGDESSRRVRGGDHSTKAARAASSSAR